MRRFLQNAVSILNGDEEFLREHLAVPASGIGIYRDSIRKRGETVVTMARSDEGRCLLLLAPSRTDLFDAFEGEIVCDDVGIAAKQCPLSTENAAALQHRSWVTVTATVGAKEHPIYDGVGPWLEAASVTPAQPPKEELVYFLR